MQWLGMPWMCPVQRFVIGMHHHRGPRAAQHDLPVQRLGLCGVLAVGALLRNEPATLWTVRGPVMVACGLNVVITRSPTLGQ